MSLKRVHVVAIHLLIVATLLGGVIVIPQPALSLTINQANHWRDISTPNTVGFFAQDVLFFGAVSVLPAGPPTSVSASQGGVNLPLFFLGGGVGDIVPGQYGRSIPYNVGLTGTWSLTGTRGAETATGTTPAPGGVASMPFANNVTISGTGLTPTISWTNPSGATIDRILIGIFDDEQPASPRKPLIFQSPALSPSTNSFTIPSNVLTDGHRYVARVELHENYGHVSTGPPQTLRSRSNAFFSLVPLKEGAPTVVYLPIVDGGRFLFDFAVEAGPTYYVDPPFVFGYQYAIGAGNPNFASVLLPLIGDGHFDLFGCSGTSLGSATGGVAHSFGPGGVSCFKVLGIEENAGLDPNDPTAFITGLTFAADGQFTGTMDPLVTPEPGTLLLLGTTATGLALARWRQRRRKQQEPNSP